MASNATARRIPTNLLSGPLAMSPGDLRKQHAAVAALAKSAVAALRQAHCLTLAGLVEKEEVARCNVLSAAGPTSSDYVAIVASAAEAALARVQSTSPDLERVLQLHATTLAQHAELTSHMTRVMGAGGSGGGGGGGGTGGRGGSGSNDDEDSDGGDVGDDPRRPPASQPPPSRRVAALVEAGLDQQMVSHMDEAEVDDMWMRLGLGKPADAARYKAYFGANLEASEPTPRLYTKLI